MAYPNRGILNVSKKKTSPNSPDWWGDIKIDPAFLASLQPDEDGLIVIKLSGWDKTSPTSGNKYLSVSVDTYNKPAEKMPYE